MKQPFANFQAALEANKPDYTDPGFWRYYRYSKRVPGMFEWLIENPQLLWALLEDAEALASSEEPAEQLKAA